MNRPPEIRYRRGCLLTFIGGFFFAPGLFLLVLAFLSRNDEFCARRGPMCLPSPDYLEYYLILGSVFVGGGIASMWVMVWRARR